MAKIKRYTELDGGYHGELAFFCLGCNTEHFINDALTTISNLPESHIWTFNDDFDKPTIRASILTRIYIQNENTKVYDVEINRCHSFITDGSIQYLSDCQHKLAGQTIELPNIY